jgi:hypothetical protein
LRISDDTLFSHGFNEVNPVPVVKKIGFFQNIFGALFASYLYPEVCALVEIFIGDITSKCGYV